MLKLDEFFDKLKGALEKVAERLKKEDVKVQANLDFEKNDEKPNTPDTSKKKSSSHMFYDSGSNSPLGLLGKSSTAPPSLSERMTQDKKSTANKPGVKEEKMYSDEDLSIPEEELDRIALLISSTLKSELKK